ncbi:hypothetical protein [Sorangium sp. So ce385]|uniref:hypothetical protein n=1 Tax=Sorangium sp. So ce385 TaxID=3133308 RepID=UPI003F5BDDD6
MDSDVARFLRETASELLSDMTPEQARGASDLDARADVFALGCVLFERLAGGPPFAGAQAMSALAPRPR